MTVDHVLALVLALALAGVHVGAGRVRFAGGPPRARGLSVFGGISVAYVFVHLLPEIAGGHDVLADAVDGVGERQIYLVALAGLIVFYGAEQLVLRARRRQHPVAATPTPPGMFRVHLATFALYSLLVGDLLVRQVEVEGFWPALLFTVAIGVHLVVNDDGMRTHHQRRYTDAGRWVLAASVLAGWLLGSVVEVSEAFELATMAFVGGAIVLNVLKEELPAERESRFWAFTAGAIAYSGLLLLVG